MARSYDMDKAGVRGDCRRTVLLPSDPQILLTVYGSRKFFVSWWQLSQEFDRQNRGAFVASPKLLSSSRVQLAILQHLR